MNKHTPQDAVSPSLGLQITLHSLIKVLIGARLYTRNSWTRTGNFPPGRWREVVGECQSQPPTSVSL